MAVVELNGGPKAGEVFQIPDGDTRIMFIEPAYSPDGTPRHIEHRYRVSPGGRVALYEGATVPPRLR